MKRVLYPVRTTSYDFIVEFLDKMYIGLLKKQIYMIIIRRRTCETGKFYPSKCNVVGLKVFVIILWSKCAITNTTWMWN